MRIAQIAPLYESVPPKYYGGTERVVSYLTEELVAQGHDVTLFASADSKTSARLVSAAPRSLRLDGNCEDRISHHVLLLETVIKQADRFDVLHFHIDYLHFPVMRLLRVPHLTTLHGRLNIPDLVPLYREFSDEPVVSISDSQREPLPWLNWQGTVQHGLPESLLSFHKSAGRYLAVLGRVSPEKGVDRAIRIAKSAGMKLKIATKVDPVDKAYFEKTIKPLLDDPLVEYVGEIDDRRKNEFLGNAYAVLFPIDWPEPFGLVMIESMACGTPVIAFRRGSVAEVMEDGVNGFIVDNEQQAVEALKKIPALDRAVVRDRFDRRFRASLMAQRYVRLYERLIEKNGPVPAVLHG